jgi:hypothetical protein
MLGEQELAPRAHPFSSFFLGGGIDIQLQPCVMEKIFATFGSNPPPLTE